MKKKISGYVAMNKGEYDIENMSFYKTKKDAKRIWGNAQDIVKIEISFNNNNNESGKLLNND